MKTLVKTNEFGKVTKAFYNNKQSAQDAAGSFLNDCTVHKSDRDKRTVEIIDFEFKKYGFSKMPVFAQFEKNNLGLFVHATFTQLNGRNFYRVTNQVSEL